VGQFERCIASSEQEVAGRLKSYIADVQDNPQQVAHIPWLPNVCVCVCVVYFFIRVFTTVFPICSSICNNSLCHYRPNIFPQSVHLLFLCLNQLLQVFQKHKELIRRPTISKELQSERETLLARLLDYSKGLLHYRYYTLCPFSFLSGGGVCVFAYLSF